MSVKRKGHAIAGLSFRGMVLKEVCGYAYMTLSKRYHMLVNRPVVAGAALKEDTNDQHIRQL